MSNKVIVTNTTNPRRAELPWLRVKVRKSLDDICHTMELELPPSGRGMVRKHDRIQVHLENPLLSTYGRHLVATIMVDEVVISADASSHGIVALGRSAARDIIDSTWSGWSWPHVYDEEGRRIATPVTFATLVRNIVRREFGWENNMVATFPLNDPTGEVGYFAWNAESPWPKLITEADAQGFMITSSATGGLFIWRPASGEREERFSIDESRNVRSIEWRENGAEQFHRYVVKSNFAQAEVFDNECNTRRVLTIDVAREGVHPDHLARRARTEMLRRREIRTAVTVPGWGLADPEIRRLGNTAQREITWSPNFIVPVTIPSMGISRSLLIAEVEHEADARTMQSTIALVRREAVL